MHSFFDSAQESKQFVTFCCLISDFRAPLIVYVFLMCVSSSYTFSRFKWISDVKLCATPTLICKWFIERNISVPILIYTHVDIGCLFLFHFPPQMNFSRLVTKRLRCFVLCAPLQAISTAFRCIQYFSWHFNLFTQQTQIKSNTLHTQHIKFENVSKAIYWQLLKWKLPKYWCMLFTLNTYALPTLHRSNRISPILAPPWSSA